MQTLQAVDVDRIQRPSVDQSFGLFPIPVCVFRWPEAEKLKNQIVGAVRQRQVSPGLVRTNRNGWHSSTDLPSWPEPAVQALTRWTARCTEQATMSTYHGNRPVSFDAWRMNGWANVNPPGGYNRLHNHARRNWHWSACYYVELGDIPAANAGGALVFVERATGLVPTGAPPRTFRFVPQEGMLIIFPSWLHHEVEPHEAGSDRISIAFNLHNEAIEKSRLWEHRPTWMWRTFPRAMRQVASWRGTPDESQNAAPPGVNIDL
jgi:uncharacterized protein (TIGR02466 family)